MNETTKREALKADLIAGKGPDNEPLEAKKKGKIFVESLEKCETSEDVINLLCQTMPLNTIKDRAGYVTENPLVLNFRKAAMVVNIDGGYDPRHGDLVMIAVEKGSHFEKDGIKGFKDKLFKDLKRRMQILAAGERVATA